MAGFSVPDRLAYTRELGAQYRQDLERLLASTPADEVVTISFRAVDAMTGSFTDEFLGKLLVARSAGLTGQAPVVLTDLTEDTSEEVDLCLERRRTAVVWLQSNTARLLGGDQVLKHTFEVAASMREFRASDLAPELRTTVQNTNNRLRKLVEAGAVVRTRRDPAAGGREFLYAIPGLVPDGRGVAKAV